jgi:RHH-type proline utilization regulon transcriptional repressor/proline dehydrogenase/delta 1-pyrroline-5-carboxylate dehydrogenase
MEPLRIEAAGPSAEAERPPNAREARIRQIGREVFAAALARRGRFLDPEERALGWTMRHPALRTSLFRFVDVLPALGGAADVAAHLRSHLLGEPVARSLPAPLRVALRLGTTGPPATMLTARAAKRCVRRLGRRFIAGESTADVVASAARLWARGIAVTVDALGETVTSDHEADAYARRYSTLIEALAHASTDAERTSAAARDAPAPRAEVSLKLTALDPELDAIAPRHGREAVARRLRPLLRLARERGVGVTVDMEHHDVEDLTLEVFRSVLLEDELRDFPHVGIVLQAYLRETERDLEHLLAWTRERGTPVTIRLVKGAYWDFEVALAAQRGWPPPVHAEKRQTDAAFERLTTRLLESHHLVRPAIATHNVRSIAHALAVAEDIRVPRASFELQMLHGMSAALQEALVERGAPLRIYAPYGSLLPGMAYLIRRLLENTSNESFLRQSFTEHAPLDELLADPAAAGARRRAPQARPGVVADPREELMAEEFVNEPTTDFTDAANRDALASALNDVRGRCGGEHPLLIGDEAVRTARVLPSLDPSRGSFVVGRVAVADAGHAERAIEVARRAWEPWRATSVTERARAILRAAERLRRRRFELAAWLVLEVGKPWREADAEVAEAIDFCRFYARQAQLLQGRPRERSLPGEDNVLVYEPRGVAAIVAPWNFPLSIATGMTVAALASGNAAIVKPAEQSPVIASQLVGLLREAGVPAGVVSYLPGLGEEVGARLVEHPGVETIAFTGSRDVGLGIIERAARTRPGQRAIKRVVAEMGGKNAIVVDTDADLDETVRGVVHSAFGYAGQKCSACSRVIVLERVHDRFLERLAAATRSLVVGPADDPATTVGPLIDEEAVRRVRRYVDLGRREAIVACEADDGRPEGNFVGPVVLDRVPRGSALARDEIFGPVLSVLTATTFEEALAIANDSDYALTGGVYSRHPAHVALARRELRVGNLYINRAITGAIVDRQPFGGLGLSGVGSKAGGPDYVRQFCDPRTICENTIRHGLVPDVPLRADAARDA